MKKTLLYAVILFVFVPMLALATEVTYVTIEPAVNRVDQAQIDSLRSFAEATPTQWGAALREWVQKNPNQRPMFGIPDLVYIPARKEFVTKGFYLFYEEGPMIDPDLPALPALPDAKAKRNKSF